MPWFKSKLESEVIVQFEVVFNRVSRIILVYFAFVLLRYVI